MRWKMAASYKKLFKMLIDREMKSKDLAAKAGVSTVTLAKMKWLKTHLPSVKWDYVNIVAYGTPKSLFGNGILFDDEEPNRKEWNGEAYDVENILEILKNL